jgi:hypothetical protein
LVIGGTDGELGRAVDQQMHAVLVVVSIVHCMCMRSDHR